jgi:DNA-binding transcriptional ArsR family regulator
VARYDPSKTFSIAARAAAKLRAVESAGVSESGIPEMSIPGKGIPQSGILEKGIPEKSTPTALLELPTRSWLKAANWLFDQLPSRVTGSPWIVYMHLYRLSAGYNVTSCRIGYGGLIHRTGLSKSAVVKAVGELREAGLVEVGDTSQEGTLFTLRVPAGVYDSGILGKGIPEKGILETSTLGMHKSGIPEKDTPSEGQLNAGVYESGIPENDHIKDKGTVQYNTQTQIVLEYLRSEGLTVPEAIVKSTVSRYGYTVDELKLLLSEIRTWADNPTGAMIQAMSDGRQASAATREAAAAAEESRRQREAAARDEQAKAAWLAAEKERLGEQGLAELREAVTARAEQEGDYVLKRGRNGKARNDHINGLVDAAILARYSSPS